MTLNVRQGVTQNAIQFTCTKNIGKMVKQCEHFKKKLHGVYTCCFSTIPVKFRSWRLSKLYFFFYKGFFIKNSNPLWKHDFLLIDFYNTTFMFSQISVRAKLQSTWPLYKQSLYKCYQVYNDGKKFKTWNRCKTQETQKDKTLAFQKGRKGRLIKTHLNKLVTRHAQYITYNFVSFLKYFLVNLTAARAQLF